MYLASPLLPPLSAQRFARREQERELSLLTARLPRPLSIWTFPNASGSLDLKRPRSSDSYHWNCLPLITIRLLGAVGLAVPRNPIGLPFLAGMASISTSSPVLNVFLVQPIAIIDTG